MRRVLSILILLVSHNAAAFCPPISSLCDDTVLLATRRNFVDVAAISSIAAFTSSFALSKKAVASGGATAGGVYLLSAKQRYNNRVTKGVTAFVGLKGALENGDVDAVRPFFTSEDEGTWKDLSLAGYLLANAFRRNSTAAPDTLPSVKKWKAFAARVEAMTKSLKKKDVQGARTAYGDALLALDEYLEKVELPSAK